MSLRDYEDFYYGACLADDPDPVDAWAKASEETHRLGRVDRAAARRCGSAGRGPT